MGVDGHATDEIVLRLGGTSFVLLLSCGESASSCAGIQAHLASKWSDLVQITQTTFLLHPNVAFLLDLGEKSILCVHRVWICAAFGVEEATLGTDTVACSGWLLRWQQTLHGVAALAKPSRCLVLLLSNLGVASFWLETRASFLTRSWARFQRTRHRLPSCDDSCRLHIFLQLVAYFPQQVCGSTAASRLLLLDNTRPTALYSRLS